MNFKKKYLKYKTKYNNLKKNLKGGAQIDFLQQSVLNTIVKRLNQKIEFKDNYTNIITSGAYGAIDDPNRIIDIRVLPDAAEKISHSLQQFMMGIEQELYPIKVVSNYKNEYSDTFIFVSKDSYDYIRDNPVFRRMNQLPHQYNLDLNVNWNDFNEWLINIKQLTCFICKQEDNIELFYKNLYEFTDNKEHINTPIHKTCLEETKISDIPCSICNKYIYDFQCYQQEDDESYIHMKCYEHMNHCRHFHIKTPFGRN